MYPVVLTLTDCDAAFPGFLYLPGEAVDALDGGYAPDTLCCFCGESMAVRGTRDLRTDVLVPQHPAQGEHDGIVSGVYSPIAGVRRMESDFSHLRCVLDGIALNDAGVLTVAPCDPYEVDVTDAGRHAS